MRTFIAITLPLKIRDYLAQIQEQFKKTQADVKWVQPQNIHLTLKFLGEIDEKKAEKISQILQEVAKNNPVYSIRLTTLGAFPKMKSPRVIWAGMDKGEAETQKIAALLEEKIAKVGIPKEGRAFSCHITLGRTRSNLNLDKLVSELENWAGKNTGQSQEFPVEKLTLFKSTLTPQGPIYEILKETHLKTT